ncbi:tail assembly protein [Paracoccus litorisediminis]|uniref:Phage-related protein, tail component n=1 Tax=Paracoccus litorisediminis TaxID=2006130 RepID=A0A844HPZ3_9RHOB|nr:tail assembly protein [Paracoccus litorisediminis]MTH61209.1 hypothetical protein [Paracoccus litorisediminis]
MRDIHLHGALGRQFGSKLQLEVETAAEAVRALCANFPTFANAIRSGFYRVVLGKSSRTGMDLGEEEISAFSLGQKPLHIVPVAKGRKNGGIGKIIAGVALIGLSMIPGMGAVMGATLWGSTTVGSVVGSVATSLILTGVASLLAPEQDSGDKTESFTMSGPQSSTREGSILPIVYGEVVTGGQMISGGVRVATDGVNGDAYQNANDVNASGGSAPRINNSFIQSGNGD